MKSITNQLLRPLFHMLLVVVFSLIMVGRASAITEKAVPADSFVEFIGIQAHLDREDPVWDGQASTWQSRLAELGIRYVRTKIGTSLQARDFARQLYRNQGVRFNVVVDGRRSDNSLNPSKISQFLAFLRDHVGFEKISSIEGPNEYSEIRYQGNDNWADEMRSYQRQLFQQVNANSRSASIPVIAPTIWRRIIEDYNTLGSLGDAADNGNLHYYNAGRKPTIYNLERFYLDCCTVRPMDLAISNAQITRPGTPVYVTETGYNIRADSQFEAHIPERTAAKYMLRLVSEFFVRSAQVKKTYIYALIDSTAERQLGLLRRDLTRRPSFFAIKNAIALLSDKGPAFTTGSLNYTLSGNLTNIHHKILQKRDGRYYLLIWNDAVSWDRTNLVEVDPPQQDLTLDISQHRFRMLKTYRPTALDLANPNDGVLPVRTIAMPRSIVLHVPDHVLIVEMIP